MKSILSLLIAVTLTASLSAADLISEKPATQQLALRMYSLIDAQVAELSDDVIDTLSQRFTEAFSSCAPSAEERIAVHKENVRFALEQSIYFRRKVSDALVDMAYTTFTVSSPDIQKTATDTTELHRISLMWQYVAIALLVHGEGDATINSAQGSLEKIKALLAR